MRLKLEKYFVSVVALFMVGYHYLFVFSVLQVQGRHLTTHLCLAIMLIFFSSAEKSEKKYVRLMNLILGLIGLGILSYIEIFYNELIMSIWFNTNLDLFVGLSLIILTLEATRRSFGFLIPVLAICVVLYPFLGHYLPEPLYCSSYPIKRTISNLSLTFKGGLFEAPLMASANYIFLFVVFGALLGSLGATRFFMDLSKVIGTKLRGGPGMMAVVSSAGVGSITGSVIANMTITGSFTIPLMKKVGYKPAEAGAIEGAASNGGQILPPIMGVAAFAMAGMTGIPYVKICVMAAIPALLYFLNIGMYVQLKAMKARIGGDRGSEKVDLRQLLFSAPQIIVPFSVIVWFLAKGQSVMLVAFWATLSTIVMSFLMVKNRPPLKAIVTGFIDGAKVGAQIGAMVASVGLIITTITMSGLGIKLAAGIESMSGGNIHIALVIIAAMCVLMGMAGVTVASYMIVAMFAVPALMRFGIPFEHAHFFVFYPACFAFISPPIALLAVVGSKLAGAPYMKTAIETIKIAGFGLILPFMFIHKTVLLFDSTDTTTLDAVAIFGAVLMVIAAQFAFVGYSWIRLSLLERGLWLIGALSLFLFFPSNSYKLFIVGLIICFMLTIFRVLKKRDSCQYSERNV